ncbi:unnamed protein product [Phaedon cochleariae]|uniref:F-actin monooxygenase n=1 Tax=Phaedon cochleariae TaxID=80249 RepID=A0A9N9X5H8_PHACE|nr:unnamed protein product [Phaedon cochleariae]
MDYTTNQGAQYGRPVSNLEAARANEYFEQFLNATSLKQILGYYRGLIDYLHLKPNVVSLFYSKLRANLTSWRAKALWKKFDARAAHKCYQKGRAAAGARVLIVGGGPCGLRTAIEAQLLGAKVVVIEKRDRFSRNNVLHLWPFVIEDLRMLGAKKFFGKFCAGAIDHISIRQLQCILLKVALLLGVEVHTEVGFEKLIEPSAIEKTGWRAEFKPADHPVAHYEFDVVIGADGKRNTLQGFSRKEFRGKLAIAITANFINKRTEAEARVEEISGVAFIFNQKFFKDLLAETRIDLENIVYYKDDTHYFVMTAKKASLLEKGVIKQDLSDTEKLLAPENVNRDALEQYAIEAASFSTNYQMPDLEFAVNHYGQPDIAMFDFTSMYAAENASKVLERNGHRLLMCLVGDSLLEPFWPTGSGCARGFLSALDAAWSIRGWSAAGRSPLDVMAERESVYRLLAQTTPDNLNKDWKSYTLDPATRYPNLNKAVVLPHQVACLYETDNPGGVERMKRASSGKANEVAKKRRRGTVDNEVLLSWLTEQLKNDENIKISDIGSLFKDGRVLCSIIHHYRPDLLDISSMVIDDPIKNNQHAIDILEKELGIPPVMTGADITNTEDYLTMASYLTEIYDTFRGEIPHIKQPKLELPESTKISELSFKTIRTADMQPLGSAPPRPSSRHKRHVEAVPAHKPTTADRKTRKRRTFERVGPTGDHENKSSSQTFRGGGGADEDLAARIQSLENKWRDPVPVDKKPKDLLRAIGKIETSDWNIKEIEKKILENKMGKPNRAVDKEKVPKWSKEQFLARQTKMEKQHLERQDSAEAKFADIDKSIRNLDQKLKEGTVRELGQNKVATITEKLASKVPAEPKPVEKSTTRPPPVLPVQGGSDSCHFCGNRVYLMERLSAEGRFFHHGCFKCQYCHTQLRLGSYVFDRDGLYGYKFFCPQHFGMIGEVPSAKVTRKPSVKISQERRSPEKKPLSGIAGVDLLDKVHTPERVEFANLSVGQISSDHDDSCQMDEDEWTDKNFGASCAELDDTDDDSSSMSETDSDDDNAYDDALEEPVTKEGTMKWAERWKNSYSRKKLHTDSNGYSSSDHSSYCENSSDDDDSETATEGEDDIRARELRKKEVCVKPPVVHPDTGTDTEIVSDDTSSDTSSEVQNSATEISTDSEFAQDDPTPTREVPSIFLNDFNVTKTRGSGRNAPKKIQVTTGYLQKPAKGKPRKPHIELKLKPLVTPALPKKLPAPGLQGYVLNRTQSTGGIATKVSLELKKKYLLGEDTSGSIQKSGSASTLDTKFKSFHTNISDCQKMLKPSTEISASMQTFCNLLNDRNSPVLTSQPSVIISKEITNESDPNKPSTVPEFTNESEGRPRSPLHETSIIVPQIDWGKKDQSLSSDSLASDSENENPKQIHDIPRVEVELAPDSFSVEPKAQASLSDPPKSIASEKKSLNQPKTLPNLENLLPEIHNSLHNKYKMLEKNSESSKPESKSLNSGLSSPESEQVTTALTETELSDWARDEVVSDDFEDGNFEVNEDFQKTKGKLAKMAEFDDPNIATENPLGDKTIITEAMNSILSGNVDFEFMDTGSETSSEDGINDSQRGYVLLKNDNEFAEDSLNPTINEVLEATNIYVGERIEQITDASGNIEQEKPEKPNAPGEEDILLIIEAGTTTEENTCSDSTVKNVTEISVDKQNITRNKPSEIASSPNENISQKPLEKTQNVDSNIEFQEHCHRLQSKVEFSNVKDSIDVRKSRRKSKPDLIQGELEQTPPQKGIALTLTPTIRKPDILYNKETLKRERDTNQRLIQEMVMNKMKAENKSLERKKKKGTVLGQTSPRDLARSATADLMPKSNVSRPSSTPDVLLSTNYPLKNSKSVNITPNSQSPTKLKIHATRDSKNIFDDEFGKVDGETPKPPPRQNRQSDEAFRKLEKLKNAVRLSSEQENVEPPESLETPANKADKKGSWLYSKKETTPVKKRHSANYELATPAFNNPFSSRTKSIPDFPQKFSPAQLINYENETMKIFKSDPNIPDVTERSRKKNKDPERRKSLSKIFSTIFSKKSPNAGGSKGLFSKLSPKMKEISKSCSNLDRKEDSAVTEPMRKKSLSESFIYRTITPPPVPPLPSNYEVKKTDESSEGEQDFKKLDHSSCDTLDQNDVLERSSISHNEKRSSKSRRASRQTQYKRHRMAQEIQRKLEETEVKTKELERRGVSVEKALRGEEAEIGTAKEDSDLMREWFDLMRDRTELRRYERELTVRAQELELEDRHARLQHELRERIVGGEINDKPKNEDDLKLEQSIISEMIEIVEKRDSLIAEIEEDRIRYSNEDRDLEEQMLAKGLRLTPLKTSPEK